jgi:hypothetical protein
MKWLIIGTGDYYERPPKKTFLTNSTNLYNTVADKKLLLGWAFKKDTEQNRHLCCG